MRFIPAIESGKGWGDANDRSVRNASYRLRNQLELKK